MGKMNPHDNWSKYYDFVYETTFGNFYRRLTDLTLDGISGMLPTGTVLDFGAGTGRLTIPLKQNKYEVIAVEKSSGMVRELKRKCVANGLDIPVFNCSIAEYSNGQADLALALFTVLSYSTTEHELSENIASVCRHIKPNGYFFFDLPNSVFFDSKRIIDIRRDNFSRSAKLTESGENNVYIYKEACSGIFDGEPFHCEDEFPIRYWSPETLDKLLTDNGMSDTLKRFAEFATTGSTYKSYRKHGK